MRRDLAGFSLLFLMPLLLTIIMSLVQDAPFKDYKHVVFKVLFLDLDNGSYGDSIKAGLLNSQQFQLIEQSEGKTLTEAEIERLIQKGDYSMGIIIPKGLNNEVANSANLIANEIGKKVGLQSSLPSRDSRDSMHVQVLFDPTVKPAFKMAMLNLLDKLNTKIQSDQIFNRIAKLSESGDSTNSLSLDKTLKVVGVSEKKALGEQALARMNSVQHNVPAWALFGIFFMVVVIAEKIIAERKGGSWMRIKTMSNVTSQILMGKVAFYVSIGIVQFYLMMLVGKYLMPALGLDALQIYGSVSILFVMVVCISICATSLGIFIGSTFDTTNQALPVGAISVVILSAIGGIWVPLEVLPKALKAVSVLSPLRWSLEGINNILLRNRDAYAILKPAGILLLLSAVMLFFSWWIERKKGIQ